MADLLENIADYYLESRDFNGYPVREFAEQSGLKERLRKLLISGEISLRFVNFDFNPYIKRFDDEPVEKQIEKLEQTETEHVVAYPSVKHLKACVKEYDYSNKPYTLKMALGEPQLRPYFFDLIVLETYRNDPRYYYTCTDIQGTISVSDEYYHSGSFPSHDKVLIEHFGFGYNDDFNRAVTAYLRYLYRLSAEHQMLWKKHELSGEYQLHPDYYRTSIRGDFPDGISIFEAFLLELGYINDMCKIIGKPFLFKKVPDHFTRPRHFAFLIRPTQKEYKDFLVCLDNLMSDNIDQKFFKDDIPVETEVKKNGKVYLERKGTIQLLEEWIKKYFRGEDERTSLAIDNVFRVFRKVRRDRSVEIHNLNDNVFDQSFFQEQRVIMSEVYLAIRFLRFLFSEFPQVRKQEYKISDVIKEGKVWDF